MKFLLWVLGNISCWCSSVCSHLFIFACYDDS